MTHKQFQEHIWRWYTRHRRDLPWRPPFSLNQKKISKDWCEEHTYEIFISEIMLQQTQVDRVIPFFERFISELPDWEALAQCPQPKLLRLWKGLGYNRRALNTKKAALHILKEHKGNLPTDRESLKRIPNVGEYTSAALMNFAHSIPTALIETNVRTVFFHHLFPNQSDISDTQIMKKVEATFKKDTPREWMYALMDYGSHLRSEGVKITSKSKHYTKQSTFKGSKREVRGKILEILLHEPKLKVEILEQKIADELPNNENNTLHIIRDLSTENFLTLDKDLVTLKS